MWKMSNLLCPAVSLCTAFGEYFQHLLVYGDRLALSAETTFQASTDGVMGSMVSMVRLDLPSPLMHHAFPTMLYFSPILAASSNFLSACESPKLTMTKMV